MQQNIVRINGAVLIISAAMANALLAITNNNFMINHETAMLCDETRTPREVMFTSLASQFLKLTDCMT
jgi:hypothetical protein